MLRCSKIPLNELPLSRCYLYSYTYSITWNYSYTVPQYPFYIFQNYVVCSKSWSVFVFSLIHIVCSHLFTSPCSFAATVSDVPWILELSSFIDVICHLACRILRYLYLTSLSWLILLKLGFYANLPGGFFKW